MPKTLTVWGKHRDNPEWVCDGPMDENAARREVERRNAACAQAGVPTWYVALPPAEHPAEVA